MPDATVVPVLAYEDVHKAAEWLCTAFGFERRLVIGDHRVQLTFERRRGGLAAQAGADYAGHSIMVRVEDADGHHERAVAAGAKIVSPPTDYPYGERQYTAEDPGGHRWTFSQSIADVDPAEWGGVLVGDG